MTRRTNIILLGLAGIVAAAILTYAAVILPPQDESLSGILSGAHDEQPSIEDRLITLQNTIAACCGTEKRNVGAESDLSVVVKLRRTSAEHEMRIEELEKLLMKLTKLVEEVR